MAAHVPLGRSRPPRAQDDSEDASAPSSSSPGEVRFGEERVAELLSELERMAAGDTERRLSMSGGRDQLDAIAYGINVLVGELAWSAARARTEQEQREKELRDAVFEAERANASKNVFLRNVSHEIRTPIAAMLGFADLLASPGLAADDRADLVDRLRANGQAVLAMLSDLLDLARLDAEKLVLGPEPVSLPSIVRDVLFSLEVEAETKGLEIRIDVDELPGLLSTDPHRLRQILVNLIANAVKFTEEGSVVVSVSVEVAGEEYDWIVDVVDTGIGIAPDRHSSLFEPFEQVDASITRTYGGSGLGLALSRKLARRLGGELILLRSDTGVGSTFRLTLVAPVVHSHPDETGTDRTAGTAANGVAGLRILLAEDDENLRMAVSRMLEQVGATVTAAGDGVEALTRIRSGSYDVVLMDLRMPRMDGLEATRTIRREGYRIPIVALTADPATEAHEAAVEAGCDLSLAKPFLLGDLSEAVGRLVDEGRRWG